MKKCKYNVCHKSFTYLLIFIFAILISVCTVTEVRATPINQNIGKEYAKIIKQYMDVVNKCKKKTQTMSAGEQTAIRKKYPNASHLLNTSESLVAQFKICYRISDLNGDKIPELIVGSSPLQPNVIHDKYLLFGIYSYNRSKGISVISEYVGMRHSMQLCKNGIILCMGPSGAAFDCFRYYKVGKNGKRICLDVVDYERNLGSSNKQVKFYKGKSNGDFSYINQKSISKNQFIKIQKKYYLPLKNSNLRFYSADDRALKSLRKGRISYKGQKNFNKKVPTPDPSYMDTLKNL